MKKVVLQFETPQDLSNFRKSASLAISHVNIANLQLTCEGEIEIVTQAIQNYGAKVIATVDPGKPEKNN